MIWSCYEYKWTTFVDVIITLNTKRHKTKWILNCTVLERRDDKNLHKRRSDLFRPLLLHLTLLGLLFRKKCRHKNNGCHSIFSMLFSWNNVTTIKFRS